MTDDDVSARSKAVVDLCIVLLVFAASLLCFPYINPLLRSGHSFGFVVALALFQFCSEGIAPLILLWVRCEHLSSFGFSRMRLGTSLLLGTLLALIYDAGFSLHKHELLWIPLRNQPAVKLSMTAGFPLNFVGVALTVMSWGFLEGFFGIYVARKVNIVLKHTGRGWLAPGVLAFAVFNGVVHLLVGQGVEGFVSSFASGYAIVVVPAITGNAWGGALAQTLTNALGKLSS